MPKEVRYKKWSDLFALLGSGSQPFPGPDPKLFNFSNSGFSLLEVLIATFVFAFGLLGIISIYSQSLTRAQNLYWRTIATMHLVSAIEQAKVFDTNYSGWLKVCQEILPNSRCGYDLGGGYVCWQAKVKEQCVTTEMLYG